MLKTAPRGAAVSVSCLLIANLIAAPCRLEAYSVFTHQQLIDLAWTPLIQPLLLSRFPHATATELRSAHAYAYGGCAIQDMGYYPFAKEFFSDLTHYVRTGDFVASLLRNARTVEEYAFAIGALSHYIGDNIGHHDAINRAAALAFPKLAAKYQTDSITYDQSPHAHIRVEFAFDVGQLSKHRLAPTAYLEFIGLKVSRRLLEQSFHEVYALHLNEVLGRATRPSIRSYRTSVRSFLPRFAHAETVIHRHDFPPDLTNQEFNNYMRRINSTEFQKLWDPYRRKPTVLTYLVAFVIRIVPKIGAASDLSLKIPTQQTDDLYITSVNRAIALFQETLRTLNSQPGTVPPIPNRDLDTGDRTEPGTYALTDKTYASLLHRVASDPERPVSAPLRDDVLAYYSDPNGHNFVKSNKKKWRQVGTDLEVLRTMPTDGAVSAP